MRPFNTFLLYVRTVPFDRLPKHPRITPCPQTRPIYGAMCEGKARLYPICVSRFVRMVLKSTKGASGCSIPSQPPSMSFQCGPRGMSSGTTDLIVLFMFGVVCVWGWVRGKGKGQAKAFSVHPFTHSKGQPSICGYERCLLVEPGLARVHDAGPPRVRPALQRPAGHRHCMHVGG